MTLPILGCHSSYHRFYHPWTFEDISLEGCGRSVVCIGNDSAKCFPFLYFHFCMWDSVSCKLWGYL